MHTLLSALYHWSDKSPSKPAILLGKQGSWRQLSYADLAAETDRWAGFWRQCCGTGGGIVFIILPHCAAMYPAYLGAMRAGLVPSFLPYPTPKQDPDLYWSSHGAVFARVEPIGILTYGELLPAVRDSLPPGPCRVIDVASFGAAAAAAGELPPVPDGADARTVALLQHSSGTTGLKKGVVLSYENVRDQIAAYATAITAGPDDRIISWLPVYHDMGLVTAFLMPITIGATVISTDAFEWLMRPDGFLDDIAKFQATLCWLPNFAFNHLVRTRDRDRTYDLSSLRALIDCSEPCKPDTVELFQRIFADHGLRPNAVQTCYGMAEMVFAVTQSAPGHAPRVLEVDREAFTHQSRIVVPHGQADRAIRFLSCGKPISGASVRIAPQGDNAVPRVSAGISGPPDIVVGEIQVAGPFLFDAYFKEPSRREVDSPWFRTGDVGFIHDGELFVCGRIKEMLIVHGRNYYANDIEEIVGQVDGVKPGRVVACGLYDPVTASEEAVVAAETTLPDDASRRILEDQIRKQVYSALSLSLRRVAIANEGTLIKTTSGKMSRSENMKRFAAGAFA